MNHRSHDLGLLGIRTMLATVFLFHGSQKLFGLFSGGGLSGTAAWMESIGIPFLAASRRAGRSRPYHACFVRNR